MANGVRTLEMLGVSRYIINLFSGYLSLMRLQETILSKITDKEGPRFLHIWLRLLMYLK